MPDNPAYIAVGTPATTSTAVDVIERASPDITTTTTADPGSGGTSLAVTSRSIFPQSGSFKIRVEAEVMYVTAGLGTGAGSFTVSRGMDGTTAAAHASGVVAAQVVGVQRVEPVAGAKQVTYRGRAATFRTLGRAGTVGQKIAAIHNASGSAVKVDVQRVAVDVMQTVAKVVEPPAVRLWKFSAVPTNGTALTKVPEDSALTSNSSVTVWQDSSAENTGSATTLTITLPANTIVDQTWAARALTLVGYEQFDNVLFLPNEDDSITLNALEGLAVFLDYTVATANPTTDKWVVSIRWFEYTLA
jgi:hypothetical protein